MRRWLAVAAVMLFISGCAATKPPVAASDIGPFTAFSGRLVVMEPARRWQVVIQWYGTAAAGEVRLTHAASNRIVQLAWQDEAMRLLDNGDKSRTWRSVTAEELATNGIILPPQQLARILSGDMPKALKAKNSGEWEGKMDGSFIRIRWSQERRRLELIDITHGRTAILIIEP